MECPKCSGGSYLIHEELVKVLDAVDPVKILIKSIFQCRACSDQFSRLFYDLLESRKRPEMQPMNRYQQSYSQGYQSTEQSSEEKTVQDGLKFF